MTTADQMFDALNLEELTIVAAFVVARRLSREQGTDDALEAFVSLAGEQAARWALGWTIAYARQRDLEKTGATSIDSPALLAALPPSMRAWAAQRLAAPVCADADEARDVFEMNAELLAQLGGVL